MFFVLSRMKALLCKMNNKYHFSYHVQIGLRNDRLQLLSYFPFNYALEDQIDTRWNIFLKQSVQFLSFLIAAAAVAPFLPEGIKAQVLWVHVHHTASRNGGGRGITKISNLVKRLKIVLKSQAQLVQGLSQSFIADRTENVLNVLHCVVSQNVRMFGFGFRLILQ